MNNLSLKKITVLFILFVSVACFLSLNAAAEDKWNQMRSKHFIVYFKDVPRDFISEIIDEAEEYYIKITKKLGFTRYKSWMWDNRGKFYIYNDKDDYLENTNQPSWSAGMARSQIKEISTYPHMSGFFDSIMPHELGHIIFREFIGTKTFVPLWLEEGVASYQERSKRLAADKIVKDAIEDNSFVPLQDLSAMDIRRSTDKTAVALFYAESVSVVNFLITKYGKDHFAWFCRDLRDGKKFDSILWRFNWCKDLSCINKAWLKYLKR